MIAYISGFINNKDQENNSIIIVNNGIGYEVTVKDTTIFKNVIVKLWISTVQREDGITLYGFNTIEERVFFMKLLSVSGVGPKTAMLILTKYTLEQFYTIVEEIIINQKLKIQVNISNEIGIKGIGIMTAVKIVNHFHKDVSSS